MRYQVFQNSSFDELIPKTFRSTRKMLEVFLLQLASSGSASLLKVFGINPEVILRGTEFIFAT